MGKGKQTKVPGTELPAIPDLEEAAEAYRIVRNERQALNIKEGDLDTHLRTTFDRLVEEGEVKIPTDMRDGDTRTIHRYEDGDGNIQDVKYTKKESKLKVNKSKVAHAGEDE